MALDKLAPSAEVVAALRSQIKLFTPDDNDAATRLGAAGGVPVYTIGLTQTNAATLEIAKLTSWRFFSPNGDRTLTAEVSVARDDVAPKLVSVSHDGKADAVRIASKFDSSDRTKGYTLRVLRIPGILLEALWLHSANDDIVIPTYSKSPELEKERQYRADEFLKRIQPVISRFLKFDQIKYEPPGLV